jgi:hypothetical protein
MSTLSINDFMLNEDIDVINVIYVITPYYISIFIFNIYTYVGLFIYSAVAVVTLLADVAIIAYVAVILRMAIVP